METTAETLVAELDAIHAALRAGRLSDLSALAARLEAQIAGLADAGEAGLDRIRRSAARNAVCLEAAARGVRAARRRLQDIRDMAAGQGTYDPQGRRKDGAGRPGLLAQRL